jgi:hypothetical protein
VCAFVCAFVSAFVCSFRGLFARVSCPGLRFWLKKKRGLSVGKYDLSVLLYKAPSEAARLMSGSLLAS